MRNKEKIHSDISTLDKLEVDIVHRPKYMEKSPKANEITQKPLRKMTRHEGSQGYSATAWFKNHQPELIIPKHKTSAWGFAIMSVETRKIQMLSKYLQTGTVQTSKRCRKKSASQNMGRKHKKPLVPMNKHKLEKLHNHSFEHLPESQQYKVSKQTKKPKDTWGVFKAQDRRGCCPYTARLNH